MSPLLQMHGINLDLTNKCSNKCPGCARDKFDSVPGRDITEHEMELIADYFQAITFCGQVSDPTLHPNFHNLLKICLDKNRHVCINVAATARPRWWFTKAFLMCKGKDVEWMFGIDGLPKDSSKYRINQDGEYLFDIMRRCALMGLKTTWQYIVFNYNENDIDTCKSIAEDLGINFLKISSGRWQTDALKSYKPSKNFSDLSGVSFRDYD